MGILGWENLGGRNWYMKHSNRFKLEVHESKWKFVGPLPSAKRTEDSQLMGLSGLWPLGVGPTTLDDLNVFLHLGVSAQLIAK